MGKLLLDRIAGVLRESFVSHLLESFALVFCGRFLREIFSGGFCRRFFLESFAGDLLESCGRLWLESFAGHFLLESFAGPFFLLLRKFYRRFSGEPLSKD